MPVKEENLSREPQSEMKKTVEKRERIETDTDDQHDADNGNREVRKTSCTKRYTFTGVSTSSVVSFSKCDK